MIGDSPLSAFPRHGLPRDRDPAGRLAALLATVLLYGVLVLLALHGFAWVSPPQEPPPQRAAIVELLPSAPKPRLALQDFMVRLIKPRLMNAPLPEIVIQPEASTAPKALLPASAAAESPLAGGAASDAASGAISGVGTGGNGQGVSACMDPAYLLAIERHVGHWYNYPIRARDRGETGVAYVRFLIDKSGRYKQLVLARGSGSSVLDAAALQTMRQAEPLPPIPDRFHTDRLDGVLPIVYQMRGTTLGVERLGSEARGC